MGPQSSSDVARDQNSLEAWVVKAGQSWAQGQVGALSSGMEEGWADFFFFF